MTYKLNGASLKKHKNSHNEVDTSKYQIKN